MSLRRIVRAVAALALVVACAPAAGTPTPVRCGADALTRAAWVGNSGGGGVTFHRMPDLDPSFHELSYPDGTHLRVLEGPIFGEGVWFARVVTDDGVEGFLPLIYLVPEPASGCFSAATPTPMPGQHAASVVRVRDARTLDLRTAGRRERVRLVGVETAEAPGCASQAAGALRTLLPPGTTVQVAVAGDVTARPEADGAALVFLWLVNGTLVNEELARRGMVRAVAAPRLDLTPRVLAAEADARAAARGIWSLRSCG